jgi:hypothetical protein
MSDRELAELSASSLLAEAQSLSEAIRANVLFLHGQLAVALGLIAGAFATGTSSRSYGAIIATLLFGCAIAIVVMVNGARIRAEIARLAGARRAVEVALDHMKQRGLVWERMHLHDYFTCVEDYVPAAPQVDAARGYAFSKRQRAAHFASSFGAAGQAFGLSATTPFPQGYACLCDRLSCPRSR